MRTILSDAVEACMRDYAEHITDMVSPERKEVKVRNMQAYLGSIGERTMGHRVCLHRDLGQRFDRHGRPLITSLMRDNYEDESHFQWAISYLVDEERGEVHVMKMIPAIAVRR